MGNVRHYDDGCQGPALTGAREMSLGASGLHAADLGDVHAILVCVAVHPGAGVRGILGVHQSQRRYPVYTRWRGCARGLGILHGNVNQRLAVVQNPDGGTGIVGWRYRYPMILCRMCRQEVRERGGESACILHVEPQG